MNITKNKFVALSYTLKDDSGNIVDFSDEKDPLEYIHGKGFLIAGLEEALEGKDIGEEISVTIEPEKGYGIVDESLIIEVERNQFPDDIEIEEGMEFEAENGQIVKVTKVGDGKVTINANHPMAGKTLHFDVKVLEVRDSTEEDLRAFVRPTENGGGCGGCCGGCGSEGSGCGESEGCGGCGSEGSGCGCGN